MRNSPGRQRTSRWVRGAAPALILAGAVAMAPAAGFVDSVGVVTHFRYADTTYGQVDALLGKLRALGVRHVRDGMTPAPTPELISAFHKLPDYGIKLNLVVGSAGVSSGVLPDPAQLLQTAHDNNLRSVVETIETAVARGIHRHHPRHDDLLAAGHPVRDGDEWDSKGGPTWLDDLRSYQCQLFDAVHQNPEWADVPVVGPSVARRFRVPLLTGMAGCQDYVNAHNYANGGPPEDYLDLLAQARANAPGKPIIVTETGYHTALNRKQNQQPVTEDVKAQYLLRTLLENYEAGVTRTFVYQLADERHDPTLTEQEAYFGLIRPDLSETPAYQALSSLLNLLSDPGAAGTVKAPATTVTVTPAAGAAATTPVEHLMLTRSDGTQFVILWQRGALPDPAAASTSVRLDLSTATPSFVVDGRTVSPAPAGTSITVTGLERVKVVQVGGAAPTFTPTASAQPPATSSGSSGPGGLLLGLGALALLAAAGGGAYVVYSRRRPPEGERLARE